MNLVFLFNIFSFYLSLISAHPIEKGFDSIAAVHLVYHLYKRNDGGVHVLQKSKSNDDLMKHLDIAKHLQQKASQKRKQLIVNRANKQTYAGPVKIKKGLKQIINPHSDYHQDRKWKSVERKQKNKIQKLETQISSKRYSEHSSGGSSTSSSHGGRSSMGFHSSSDARTHSSVSSPSVSPTSSFGSSSHHSSSPSHESGHGGQSAFHVDMLSKHGRQTEKWLNRVQKDPKIREHFRKGLLESDAVMEAEKADKRHESLQKYSEKIKNRSAVSKKVKELLPKMPFSLESKADKVAKSGKRHLENYHSIKHDIQTHLDYGNLQHPAEGNIFHNIADARDSLKTTRALVRLEKSLVHHA